VGDENTLVVAISQSGETTDTLAAVEAARGLGARVLAVTNTRGSLITREADAVLLTHAGPEICVASTKAFVAQVAILDLLALDLARARGAVAEEDLLSLGRDLRLAPEKVGETLALLEGKLGDAVEIFEGARCSLFLGRGPAFPVALEGALKLKEISYVPSEGYAAGEMKHGPIALVDGRCPVVAVLGEGTLRGGRPASCCPSRRRPRSSGPSCGACRCNCWPARSPKTGASTWTSRGTSPRA
jgi:glucosamine--fructose-6-phosphate aminotransferase (isomerizing)